jgi:hypothetical protein
VLSPQIIKSVTSAIFVMQHVSISFYQRRKESTKEVAINCRITIQGKRLDISTGLKISPQLFDTSRNMAIGRSSQASNVNRRLDLLKTEINSIIIKYDHANEKLYLKGTTNWGICYTQPSSSPDPSKFDPEDCMRGIVAWPTDGQPQVACHDRMDTYTDSNWGPQDASHPKPGETRTDEEMYSLLGAVVTYMGGPLDWCTTREKRCSRSVCESEIKAMDEGVKLILALRHLFEDLEVPHLSEPTPIMYCDNQGGIAWAHSEAVTKRLRQIRNTRECTRKKTDTGETHGTPR